MYKTGHGLAKCFNLIAWKNKVRQEASPELKIGLHMGQQRSPLSLHHARFEFEHNTSTGGESSVTYAWTVKEMSPKPWLFAEWAQIANGGAHSEAEER
jgi:hypothetical protein